MEQSYGIILFHGALCGNLKILLIRGSGTNDWTFAKGRDEINESPVQAALREVWEETGIAKIKLIPELFYLSKYNYMRQGQKIFKSVMYFVGFVGDMKVVIQPEEVMEYKWVGYEDALLVLSFTNEKGILMEVMGYLSKNDANSNFAGCS